VVRSIAFRRRLGCGARRRCWVYWAAATARPSRNILGSYFPSWMVCALVGLALALAARAIFKALGMLEELPVPLVVMLAIGCAGTFAMWLIWLS